MTRMTRNILYILFLLLAGTTSLFAQTPDTIRYVKESGTYTNNGRSWANAKSDLQGAINDLYEYLQENNLTSGSIYVAAGTGNGYRRGNSGKDDENGLQFLRGGKWKKGKGHRKRRDWFSKKYLYSLHRLNDFEAEYYGETYQGLLAGALSAMFGDPTASVKSNNGKTGATGALGNL